MRSPLFPTELEDLGGKFIQTFTQSKSGTLSEDVAVGDRSWKPERKGVTLPPDATRAFRKWIRDRNLPYDPSDITPCRSFVMHGATFANTRSSPRDGNIVVGRVSDGWSAGELQFIAVAKNRSSEDELILLAIKLFEDLGGSDILKDPYRAFPVAGGRAFYDTPKGDLTVISSSDPFCHFVRSSVNLGINRGHFHALPLDKVSQSFGGLYCMSNNLKNSETSFGEPPHPTENALGVHRWPVLSELNLSGCEPASYYSTFPLKDFG